MSISIKPDSWHVKDENGQYRGTAIFSSTLPSEAHQIVTESIAEINAVKATIPQDYTELVDEVGDLSDDVTDLSNAISQKEDALSIVQKASSDVTITLEEDKFYIFPTMTELTVTCPLTGLYGFRFTSGTTPTVFLMSGITMPDSWNGTEAGKTYDMTILNGLALVTSWSV